MKWLMEKNGGCYKDVPLNEFFLCSASLYDLGLIGRSWPKMIELQVEEERFPKAKKLLLYKGGLLWPYGVYVKSRRLCFRAAGIGLEILNGRPEATIYVRCKRVAASSYSQDRIPTTPS